MNPKDIRTTHDVARWLRNYVEWSSEASRDMMLAAVDVLTAPGDEATTAYERGRQEERTAAAAYCLDRADQYPTKSPIWVGLADCAEGIAKGEASDALQHGETEDLLERVRMLAGSTKPTPKPRKRPRNLTPLTKDKIG